MSTYMSRSAAPFWLGKELPKHIIYLYKNWPGEDWKEYTIYNVIEKKVARQKSNLLRKRSHDRTVPCYIWVFYNDTWLMGGWYIYVECRYGSFALNFRAGNHEKFLFEKIRQRYHFGIFPEFKEQWFNEFCKKYPKRAKGVKIKQGLMFTHCRLSSGNQLIDVL